MDIKKEMETYLQYCEFQKKLDQKTLKAYKIDLSQFVTQLNVDENSELTKDRISFYISNLHVDSAPKTAKRKIASLRAFLNHLEFEEVLEVNPLRKIRLKFQEPHILPRTIPLKTIEHLLSHAYHEHQKAQSSHKKCATLRDLVILELLFMTGARISEICTLKMSDIDLDNAYIRIMGKGAKERIIQIGNEHVLNMLIQYQTHRSTLTDSETFFFLNRLGARLSEQSVRHMLSRMCKDACVTLKITPHMFRHSFATLLLEEDVDIRYIQKMLGHSSIQTTQIYTQVTSEKQKQILRTKHPRNKLSVE